MSINSINSLSSYNATQLQKRKKQLKNTSLALSISGTAAAGLALLAKNKLQLPCAITSVILLLGALKAYSSTKQIDKKLNEIA